MNCGDPLLGNNPSLPGRTESFWRPKLEGLPICKLRRARLKRAHCPAARVRRHKRLPDNSVAGTPGQAMNLGWVVASLLSAYFPFLIHSGRRCSILLLAAKAG
jgi:hypothetical protein